MIAPKVPRPGFSPPVRGFRRSINSAYSLLERFDSRSCTLYVLFPYGQRNRSERNASRTQPRSTQDRRNDRARVRPAGRDQRRRASLSSPSSTAIRRSSSSPSRTSAAGTSAPTSRSRSSPARSAAPRPASRACGMVSPASLELGTEPGLTSTAATPSRGARRQTTSSGAGCRSRSRTSGWSPRRSDKPRLSGDRKFFFSSAYLYV